MLLIPLDQIPHSVLMGLLPFCGDETVPWPDIATIQAAIAAGLLHRGAIDWHFCNSKHRRHWSARAFLTEHGVLAIKGMTEPRGTDPGCQPSTTPVTTLTDSPPISKPGEVILRVLLKDRPKCFTIDAIVSECNKIGEYFSDKTIRRELTLLIDLGLAARPRGKRRGATLTPAGVDLACKLETKQV
jgi:hypothetical protein